MTRFSKTLCICVLTLTFFTSNIHSQTKNDKTVVGTVGKQKITYSELKSNMSTGQLSELTLTEMEDFLPVYLEYIAKIQFAKDQGVMNDPELLEELSVYAKQASYSYLLDNKIKQTEFDEYFDRASTEIKSEHILISLPQNPSPEDTLAVYQRLIEARNKFLNGTTIPKLDSEYSSKQNGRSMGGDLPWFSIGTTVKEFEDVIYSLEKGEISMPFRTQFGYHIVHLQDKRERTLSRSVSHIFTRAGSNEAKTSIELAFEKLNSGTSWAEAALQYSQDNLSSSNGGKIGWINYGRYNSDFVDSVMAIDPELEYSKPIKTVYGYHIFKIDSVQTFATIEEKKESYMKEFLDSPNFKKSNTFVINWLKTEYKNSLNTSSVMNYSDWLISNDTTAIGTLSLPSSQSNSFYSFKDYEFSVKDFHNYLVSVHPSAKSNSFNQSWVDDFQTYAIDSIITDLTTEIFPEFESTLNNYRKGLAVYQINDTYLWSAETVDTTKLKQIFDENPQEYTYPKRYYYHMLSALADSTLDNGINFITEGGHPDSLRTYYPKVAVNKDSTGVFSDEPFNRLVNMKENSISERFEYKRRKAVFYLNEILEKRKMTFDEAFNRLLTDYQPQREKKWLDEIKKRYKVKPNLKKLRSAYKKDTSL